MRSACPFKKALDHNIYTKVGYYAGMRFNHSVVRADSYKYVHGWDLDLATEYVSWFLLSDATYAKKQEMFRGIAQIRYMNYILSSSIGNFDYC